MSNPRYFYDWKNMQTAPILLAKALGKPIGGGKYRCAYCGAGCGDEYSASVSKTFMERPRMADHTSPFRCVGCETAMEERAVIEGHEGPQKRRNYSWLISSNNAIACTKANISLIRDWCLHPPEPPFAICISDSGQKHLLFLTPVNTRSDFIIVTLEGECIAFNPHELKSRIDLCMMICAASGKSSLIEWDVGTAIRIGKYWPITGCELIESFSGMRLDALSRLASWLTPNQKECRNVYPGESVQCRGVPSKVGGNLFDEY